MISICCSEPKPNYQDLSFEEYRTFFKLVYLLRERGYSVMEAQEVAFQKLLEERVPF
jgi:hypothetical protein